MKDFALKISGVVFLLIALLHGVRLWFQVDVQVGDVHIPLWVSGLLVLGPSLLAGLLFKALKSAR